MTMKERVTSYRNEYFDGLIEKYTAKKQAPESHGMNRAIIAYLHTNDASLSELMVDDMPFSNDMDDFMGTIEAAGITEFLLCDDSTALMESLHYLFSHGWQVVCTCEVETSRITTKQGLRMRKA